MSTISTFFGHIRVELGHNLKLKRQPDAPIGIHHGDTEDTEGKTDGEGPQMKHRQGGILF